MNSKQCSNRSSVFLVLAVLAIILQPISPINSDGVFAFLIMASIYNVGASIHKAIERLK